MSGIVGSKLNIRGSGRIAKLGTDGQVLTSAGAGLPANYEDAGGGGAITWCTTAKTGAFCAASGSGYLVNTCGGAITATLPGSPSVGDEIAFVDFAGTFGTTAKALTLARNSLKIKSKCSCALVGEDRGAVQIIYTGTTQGWITTSDTQDGKLTPIGTFIAATGGDSAVTVDTDFKVHTFNSPGTFCVSAVGNACGSNTVDYLVVAGGGGGGSGAAPSGHASGGAGGAGGYRLSNTTCQSNSPPLASTTAIPVSASPGAYTITVGGGGAASSTPGSGGDGNDSVFSTITADGGGAGGGAGQVGVAGGSGGSGGTRCGSPSGDGDLRAGNVSGVSPPEGQPSGFSAAGSQPNAAGGGGGAGIRGWNGQGGGGANGGCGAQNAIDGTLTYYAGGGGGGVYNACGGYGGSGGLGNPGGVGGVGQGDGGNGTTNKGGGGGGGSTSTPTGPEGGAGGSGVVKIRYRFQRTLKNTS